MAISDQAKRHRVAVPFSHFQYLDVEFGDADVDTIVEHSLFTTDPEAVNYEVVRSDQACRVYHDSSATRKLWGQGYIILRSDTADAVVRLRLSLEP